MNFTATPKDNAIIRIWEWVVCSLHCQFCDAVLDGAEDEMGLAEYAYREGWRVRKDEIRCPKCINKKAKSCG